MTPKFFIIRHGEAKSNDHDSPLNDRGEEQAEKLAEFLSGFTNFENDIIISSPFLRASQTAAIITARTDQTFCTDKRLEERNIGDYQGEDLWGDLKKYFKDMEHKFPNGEANGEVLFRVNSLMEGLKNSNYQNIFLITHRFTMMLLFNHLDESFDFDKGEVITNPDVYTLNFINGEVEIERLWNEQ
ncbi:histidine phosphatase family protein [Bacillus toyonensis]|uniref:histidine phosphatase family protein n=1 Tax=Bacillus toyonensis TaxID=155322 RepID=UPI001444865F|nr:histidine phosphatase family protein [Bacillus toyonensis]NKW96677.1 histidine phosphatase family protein [Bacillus toyonensis]HDR7848901.1 histidine phosphatase family protein [Bacillus toyonensis]